VTCAAVSPILLGAGLLLSGLGSGGFGQALTGHVDSEGLPHCNLISPSQTCTLGAAPCSAQRIKEHTHRVGCRCAQRRAPPPETRCPVIWIPLHRNLECSTNAGGCLTSARPRRPVSMYILNRCAACRSSGSPPQMEPGQACRDRRNNFSK
jgi:hypothetical protein